MIGLHLMSFVIRVRFTIDVKIQGFLIVASNGCKSYTKGMVRKWVVDHERFSMEFLMKILELEIGWGPDQVVVV